MKLQELIKEEQEQEEMNLYGLVVNGIIINKQIYNRPWYKGFRVVGIGLTSLEGSPKVIEGTFDCSDNSIKNLVGGPTTVHGYFNAFLNSLTSLEGAPRSVGKGVDISHNPLKSLKDVHKHFPIINGQFNLNMCPLKSHVLGLLLIQGLSYITIKNLPLVERILNNHIHKGRAGLIDCQNELIDAGFEEYAQI